MLNISKHCKPSNGEIDRKDVHAFRTLRLPRYTLYSVISHHGESADGGHYNAIVRYNVHDPAKQAGPCQWSRGARDIGMCVAIPAVAERSCR